MPRLTVKSYRRTTPVKGASVYGLLARAVRPPQGNPSGSGLLERNLGNVGAWRVPQVEILAVALVLDFCITWI